MKQTNTIAGTSPRGLAKLTLRHLRLPQSPHMAKRLLGLMFATLVSIFMAKAQESLLAIDGISPSPGSEISSFDFVLKFDLTKVIETYDEGEYGIGWAGYHNDKRPEKEQSITIYKGDPSEGIVIGRTFTSGFTGKSNGFVVGPEVNISIEGVIPEPGVAYTMLITNGFRVYAVGSSSMLQNSVLDCMANPITYTFVGAGASSEKLSIAECSITANQVIDELTDITFNFSQPVDINSGVFIEVLENDAIYAQSNNAVLSDDKMSVTYHFDNTALLLNHSYVISLPKGAVSSASNASETNDGFNIPVVGNYVGLFTFKSSSPSSTEKAIFSKIEGIFDMPEGFQIYKKPEYALNLSAKLYEGGVAEANLVATLDGVYNDNKNGIIWTCNAVLKPDTRYILYKPEREFRAYEVATDKFTYEWYNGEVMLTLYTPSIEESGYPPIELGDPVIGKHDAGGSVLKNGDSIGTIDLLEIAPVDIFYTGKDGDSKFRLADDTYGHHTGYLYDITTGTPELVKEVDLSAVQRETSFYYYTVISARLSSVFFENHRYRFVIPKDEFTILYPPLYNYVRTPEYSIEFEGSTPTEARLVSCTLQEGEELSELGNVVWTFNGQFELNSEAEAILNYKNTVSKYMLTSNYDGLGNTRVVAHIYLNLSGKPLPLQKDVDYTLTLPEGALYYLTDASIVNKEVSVTFKGVEAKPEVQEPEFVNAEVSINGFHTANLEAVKGRKLNVSLIPDGNWVVTALTRDGNDVLPFMQENDGVYTTPALTADTKIAATIEYDGVIINDIASEVVEIPETAVKVYSDGEHIVVDGINAGDVVAVYSTNGMLIAKETMDVDHQAKQITIASGQIYIVRVNDTSVKILHQ